MSANSENPAASSAPQKKTGSRSSLKNFFFSSSSSPSPSVNTTNASGTNVAHANANFNANYSPTPDSSTNSASSTPNSTSNSPAHSHQTNPHSHPHSAHSHSSSFMNRGDTQFSSHENYPNDSINTTNSTSPSHASHEDPDSAKSPADNTHNLPHNPTNTNGTDSPSVVSTSSSHRFFLRRKNSRNSLSPQSSTTSLSSLLKKSKDKNRSYDQINRRTSSSSVLQHHANNTSTASVNYPNHHTPDQNNNSAFSSVNHSLNNSPKTPHQDLHNPSPTPHANNADNNSDSGSSTSKQKKQHGGRHNNNNGHHHLSLKRFIKKLKHTDSNSSKHSGSSSSHSPKNILPQHSSSDLYRKYGGLGKLIGTGASGSVNLVTLKDDPNQIFAVKKFRPKLQNESEHDYKVKVKNEFKIGQYLSHENLIHTIELIKENSSKLLSEPDYYIIMEYCPYDFFNLVMSGLMSREEIFCYFKQITNGVAHLHANGISHRDLKLDNCVVNDQGILKLIDFGSAVQFRKEKQPNKPVPEEDEINSQYRLLRARGVVGSDPYLSPEVFEPSNFGYDPRAADVWSIAIIFCCMILKRFPWKIPKLSDPSYKSFANLPEGEHSATGPGSGFGSGVAANDRLNEKFNKNMRISEQHKPSRGPDRLLRLLPHESRILIKSMLEINPKNRFLIDDVVNHTFFTSIEYCRVVIEQHGNLDGPDFREVKTTAKASGHTHHLVTEDELKKINMEKERTKKLKENGVA